MFDRQEVARVAGLARIDLTEEEITQFAQELGVITAAIQKVSEIVTPEVPATSHPIPLTNVMRDDVPSQPFDVEKALASAPASEDGLFLVPQILGEE
ncbi:MAG: Asp-tRNA(Asn)/Glu-tRNA(Gln) amidotransferase subunit GatC [bacterium]|nr:Asp-tRNA(Asn)/Glu-tRNA(Gln) amidotransferase subunit GatC [bacterium]